MRFRRVGAQVMDGSGGGGVAVGEAVPARRITTHGRNRETTMAFALAWSQRDLDALRALGSPEISCRWIGFGSEPVTARGLDALLEVGTEFEQRYGVAERYTLVEAMGGESHAAILWEPSSAGAAKHHVARVAIYRLENERITSIAVYADHAD